MERLLENALRVADQSAAGRPRTDKGYTVVCVERYARPVKLSLDVLPQHIDTVVRDLAWREPIYDLVRLFKDNAVRESITGTVGQEMYNQIIPWLKRTIGDRAYDRTGNDFWNSLARRIRLNTTIVGLGYRGSTMILHGATAMSNSIGELGIKWMGVGMKEFYGEPWKMAEARDFVNERSSEMRHRMQTMDRDVRDGLRELLDKEGFVPGFKRWAYYGIGMLDMASAMPTWLGAYEKALAPEAEGGLGMKSESDAIYYADKAVRNAHGAGGAEDLAAFQHGSEWQKLAGMFYTFWSHFYNREVNIARKGIEAVRDRSVTDFAAVLARSWWYFVMPMVFHGLIKGGGPEGEEGWISWAAKEIGLGVFSGIPIIRDFANAISTGREYKPTPALAIVDALRKSTRDIEKWYEEEDVSPHWLRHSLETAGYVFGLPTGQAAQSLQYLWDVWDGEQDPEDVKEFMQGMVFGGKKKAH
ncbi:MAG TPA: hypothetical protein VEF34_04235 [Syntrophobacteraceae bacterium]|nr:hypothetical protein [Syntrophobacteraceae bacterium]